MGASAVPLTTDLNDPEGVPYFLWDEPMTVGELRRRLSDSSSAERWRPPGEDPSRGARPGRLAVRDSPRKSSTAGHNWCGTWDAGARFGSTSSMLGLSRDSLAGSRLTSL